MWIRTNDVICKADEFSRIYMEDMSHGRYGVLGKGSDNLSTMLGVYKDSRKAKVVLDSLYIALEQGDDAFTMPESDIWY